MKAAHTNMSYKVIVSIECQFLVAEKLKRLQIL